MSNLESGSTLGRYRIERFLGAGAMGEVYLAEDPHIERPIAIKTVRLVGRPQEVEDRKKRLLREARAAGRLLHPNVVTLFDTGEQEGVLFLAFEFVEGADLASLLEGQGVLSLGEVLRTVRQTADALDYAHRQGIVHRDIKPSNILIDKTGRVKVADFGIAKVAGQSTELTVAGSVMGSPQYLSPEQIRGEDLDGRSDIFSLGVVVYELLLGRRPFDGDSITTLVYQILHKDLPAVSELRAVPPRLEQLLSRMLAKDRDARIANAGEVAREIAAIENELPDETLIAPANRLPMDETYVLPKRMTTASLPPPPPPSPSTKVSAARDVQPGGLPPIPPPPGAPPPVPAPQPFVATGQPPTPVGTVIGPLPGAAPVREGRPWALLLVVAAAVLVLAVGLALGWRLISSRLHKPEDSVAATTTEATDATATPTSPGTMTPGPGTAPVPTAETSTPTAPETAPGRTVTPEPVRIQPTQVPPATDSSRTTTPPRPVPPPQETAPRQEVPRPADRPRVETPAPTPAPVEEPAPDEEEDDEPAAPAPGAIASGLALAFRVAPPDAYVLVDGRVIGKAEDWSGGKRGRNYTLPGPGRYEIKIKKDGLGERRMTVEASATGGVTPILATLKPLPAADVPSADVPVIRVSEGVAFRLQPPAPLAQILVDGQSAGSAKQFAGGLRGEWLILPEGRHRVSVVAPGRRRDYIVEVFPGSPKARERITVDLSPGGRE